MGGWRRDADGGAGRPEQEPATDPATTAGRREQRRHVMSSTVGRALRLLEFVVDGEKTLNQLAALSGFSRSATHRLAGELVRHRYLQRSEHGYGLGYRLLELGERKKAGLGISRTAMPLLQAYCERTGETVHLAVLDGTHIVILERIVGTRQLQVNAYVGQRTPAYRTAVGKALISARPEREWPMFLAGMSVDDRRRTQAELHAARSHRYAFDLEESNVGVCCVAAAIGCEREHAVAAVSFNGAHLHLTEDRLRALAPVIVECADEVSRALQVA